ncbi:signal transduction histidine kinase [Microbacterium resistens]|uniref:histidine kinase n=1 Tax=Microbacterium resistens TaxID=156977 RepID=A0ABU1SCK4_9MICO|nr:histidine kinase [Microbacterium resistens]MDR6867331.1 signal transduction histidine kinase [Microbacterium resistens]
MFRSVPRVWLVFDIVGAALGLLVTTPISLVISSGEISRWLPSSSMTVALYVVVGVVFWGAAAISRISPRLALIVAWTAAAMQMAVGFWPSGYNLAIPIVLFATAAWGTRTMMWLGGASAALGGVVAGGYFTLIIHGQLIADDQIGIRVATVFVITTSLAGLTLVVGWGGGLLWRSILKGRRTREAQVHAEAVATTEQERVRIARDMHDVVAHSLAVVIAQSDGARYAAAADPASATAALTTIGQTARAALSDVRLLLTQLRHSQGQGPQPTLADLETLYGQVRAAGVEPRVTVDPMPPGEPPAAIQLAVYRILQEALTNALRHGGGDVDVRLSWWVDRVDIGVANDIGAGHVSSPGGHGLVGMRERAQLVGGTLTAERVGDRFVVNAALPIGGPA